MANTIEIKVPDIGDFDAVPVIELLVAVGDTVTVDQGLVTLESDKATMEVPSSAAGVVRELKVKIGDEVAEGAVIAILEAEGEGEGEGGGAAEAKSSAKQGSDGGKSTSGPADAKAPTAAKAEPAAQAAGAGSAPAPAADAPPRKPAVNAPDAAAASGRTPDVECAMLVLGAGPACLHVRLGLRGGRRLGIGGPGRRFPAVRALLG